MMHCLEREEQPILVVCIIFLDASDRYVAVEDEHPESSGQHEVMLKGKHLAAGLIHVPHAHEICIFSTYIFEFPHSGIMLNFSSRSGSTNSCQ